MSVAFHTAKNLSVFDAIHPSLPLFLPLPFLNPKVFERNLSQVSKVRKETQAVLPEKKVFLMIYKWLDLSRRKSFVDFGDPHFKIPQIQTHTAPRLSQSI